MNKAITRRPTQNKEQERERIRALEAEVHALKQHLTELQAALDAQADEARQVHALKQRLAELEGYYPANSVVRPRRLPPPGKSPFEMVMGQWPGEETTEELLAELKRMG